VVAFLGQLRPDKGGSDIAAIAEASQSAWDLDVIGPQPLSALLRERLAAAGVRSLNVSELPRPVSDTELIGRLLCSDVVIAPYKAVTETSSIHLAIALGVPVLGYESDALSRLLTKQSMATTAGGLGRLLDAFAAAPWPTHAVSLPALVSAAERGWADAISYELVGKPATSPPPLESES
jgi:glycosyltransferase involved in cell wall biosynthesis